MVRYGAIRTTVELKSIYRHFSKLSPGSPTYIVPPPPPGVPPRKREINNIRRIISLTQTSHNAPSHLACVASVSNRGIARKLERKQKKVEGGEGGEKRKLPSFPSPSPVIFFCSGPSFLDEPREETLATQATSHYKWLLRIKPHFFHITSIGWIFLLVFSKSDSRQYYDFSNHSLAFIQFIFRILFLYVTVKKSKRMYRMVGALTFNVLSSD